MQLHTRHTNFIHIDTKVDFSRNVLLCQRGRVEWHVVEGWGGEEGTGRVGARVWVGEAGQRGLGKQEERGIEPPCPVPSTLEDGGCPQTYSEHPEWWEMGARELRQEEALGGIAAHDFPLLLAGCQLPHARSWASLPLPASPSLHTPLGRTGHAQEGPR